MADLHRQPLDGRSDDGEGGEIGRMPVTGDHLARHRLDGEAELFGDVRLDPWIHIGEGADGPRNGAGGDLIAGHGQPVAGADELGIVAGELQAERGRLGVDAVAAADTGRKAVLQRPALQGREHQLNPFNQKVRTAGELDREAGVEHVGRRHALVQEARLRPHDFGDVGQERDDVVLGRALDLVDAVGVELGVLALGPDGGGGVLGDHAQLRHRVRRVRLDLEPDAIAGLGGPDVGRLRPGIARDHGAERSEEEGVAGVAPIGVCVTRLSSGPLALRVRLRNSIRARTV